MTEDIIVYTTPTWPYCDTVKEFLSQKGVNYEELDVADNEEARREMLEKTGRMAVPTIIIDGEVIVGFDREKIEEHLH